MAQPKIANWFFTPPKKRFENLLVTELKNNHLVDAGNILVGDVPLPNGDQRYCPVWIAFFELQSTVGYGRDICEFVLGRYRDSFSTHWVGIEIFLGFMQAGQFHKTYRLSAFNADIESVMSQLEKGLVGMKGKSKRGELLTTDIRLTLVDEAE